MSFLSIRTLSSSLKGRADRILPEVAARELRGLIGESATRAEVAAANRCAHARSPQSDPCSSYTPNLYQIDNLWRSLADMTRKPLIDAAPRLEILKGLTFSKGEILGIVGASGFGKSPLGRALLRLPEPSAGRILCDG